jgi:peptidoglycan/LPS O-acetylase OafA/YrhL
MEKRIAFLDYLRVFAFASVFIGHLYPHALEGMPFLNRVIFPFVQEGVCGVIVFFLISGYIINEVLRIEYSAQFLVRRFFRIYPLYIFAVLIELMILSWQGAPLIPWPQILSRMLLIGDLFNTPLGLQGIEWTLRAELLFYVWMSLAKATRLFDHKKYFFFSICVVSILSIVFYSLTHILTFFVMPILFAGTVMNLFKHREIDAICLMGFMLPIIAFPAYFVIMNDISFMGDFYSFFLGIALFIMGYYWQEKITLNATVYFISQLTFGIYLFHNFLMPFLVQSLDHTPFPNAIALVLFTFFVIAIHFLIEKPANRLGHLYT